MKYIDNRADVQSSNLVSLNITNYTRFNIRYIKNMNSRTMPNALNYEYILANSIKNQINSY